MPRKRPTIEIKNHEWVDYSWTEQHEECCGCGCIHVNDYRVHEGKLQIRTRQIKGPDR